MIKWIFKNLSMSKNVEYGCLLLIFLIYLNILYYKIYLKIKLNKIYFIKVFSIINKKN